jgi:hypothetical protein
LSRYNLAASPEMKKGGCLGFAVRRTFTTAIAKDPKGNSGLLVGIDKKLQIVTFGGCFYGIFNWIRGVELIIEEQSGSLPKYRYGIYAG